MLRFSAKKPSFFNPLAKGGKTRGSLRCPLVRGANSVSPVPSTLLFDFDDQFDFDGDAAGELYHAYRGSRVPAAIAEHLHQ